jgi:hypothetical protein
METHGGNMFRTQLMPVLLLVLTLAACGGSGSAPQPGTADTEPGGVTAEAPSHTSKEPQATSGKESAAADDRLGPPLADPSRYYGVYAAADSPDRKWFVAEAKRPKYAEQAPEVPPGHLALGAMFGDVSPWHLRTVSDTEFAQAWVAPGQPEAVSIQFELDGDGDAVAFRFTNQQNESAGRLERAGDLPEGWD